MVRGVAGVAPSETFAAKLKKVIVVPARSAGDVHRGAPSVCRESERVHSRDADVIAARVPVVESPTIGSEAKYPCATQCESCVCPEITQKAVEVRQATRLISTSEHPAKEAAAPLAASTEIDVIVLVEGVN